MWEDQKMRIVQTQREWPEYQLKSSAGATNHLVCFHFVII